MPGSTFTSRLIAPCGMNCGVCRAYLRQSNPCCGCNDSGQPKPKTREQCRLKLCGRREGKFCYSCAEFPCARLGRMDLRYLTRYGMSEIDNLIFIRDHGIRKFLEEECKKWVSDQGVFCVQIKIGVKSLILTFRAEAEGLYGNTNFKANPVA